MIFPPAKAFLESQQIAIIFCADGSALFGDGPRRLYSPFREGRGDNMGFGDSIGREPVPAPFEGPFLEEQEPTYNFNFKAATPCRTSSSEFSFTIFTWGELKGDGDREGRGDAGDFAVRGGGGGGGRLAETLRSEDDEDVRIFWNSNRVDIAYSAINDIVPRNTTVVLISGKMGSRTSPPY
ncbi:hypothetical protein D9756_001100 [Leucocoprinus leucothites]|uniref:Uncharacterized protein n=1 Tax=Leucocoprinus leucothites TaxID=201217 RepID=A0A8H5GEV2_9AGAR|nr:hypothetical protein D9756_001100 [Leucoagaricus leucothites]